MLGRTPDYVNIQLTTSMQLASLFGEKDPKFAENLRAYHEYVRERDLCLTHAFGHPQVNRSVGLSELPDPYVAVGVVVRGAKNLATLAPFAVYTVDPYQVAGCEDCLELVAEDLQDPDTQHGATASTAAGRSPPPVPSSGGGSSGAHARTVDDQVGNSTTVRSWPRRPGRAPSYLPGQRS